MKISQNWTDYSIIATGDGYKLERWKDVYLLRPDPQVIWAPSIDLFSYPKLNAYYKRSEKGGGAWKVLKPIPAEWNISYETLDLNFKIKPMGFKHTGLFPEQAVNWKLLRDTIKNAGRPVKALNLFAYTGGATLACLEAGASVTHVDASKGMVQWAKENANASGIADRPVRWLVDDCLKFVKREIRRGNKYDIIIMDPPSYGRGPDGEIWKFENQLAELLTLTEQIFSEDALLLLINSYTTGMSPTIMNYMTDIVFNRTRKGSVETDEIGLKVTNKDIVLPCGCTTIWKSREI